MAQKIFYLAHPVADDNYHGMQSNLAHTLKVLRICHEAGLTVICPWYADTQAFEDGDPLQRGVRMAIQKDIITALGGNLILAGHRISPGMLEEFQTAHTIEGSYIIDVVGVRDEDLLERLVECATIINALTHE